MRDVFNHIFHFTHLYNIDNIASALRPSDDDLAALITMILSPEMFTPQVNPGESLSWPDTVLPDRAKAKSQAVFLLKRLPHLYELYRAHMRVVISYFRLKSNPNK